MPTGYVKIEGVEEALRQLDKAPDKLLKIVEKSMATAARKVVRTAKSGISRPEFRDLLKYKVVKGTRSADGNTTTVVGMFKARNTSHTTAIQPWFKAYWANYGTLTHRDPGHQFVDKIKKPTKNRRNNVGQDHENFFDEAMGCFDTLMPSEFEKALIAQQDKIIGNG